MENFSNISRETKVDQFLQEMVNHSGLNISDIKKLYGNFSLNSNNFDEIKEKFNDFFNVNFDNFDLYIDKVSKITENVVNKNIEILNILQNLNTDSSNFLKILSHVLYSKNSEKFYSLANDLNIHFNLMESNLSVDKIVGVSDNSNIEENIFFYDSLKTILAKNNSRWGNNYHLDNVYNTIVNYIENEIQELTTKNSINTVTDSFHMELMNNLLFTSINPMYKNVDILRTLIPDMQTLVFDLVVIINKYVVDNLGVIQNVNVDVYNGYLKALQDLYEKISSSRESSKLCENIEKVNQQNLQSKEYIDAKLPIFLRSLEIKSSIINTYYNPIVLNNVVDSVYIIKSCSVEFNLSVRPALRNFVTKTFELLSRTEKAIIKSKQL